MGKAVVRLKDIADRTGFSTNTVSLALRDSPRIPEETRNIIKRAADALNYLPNQIAKSLVSRETRTIGLVLTQMTNPALTGTAQALETELAARGYGTLFATSNNRLEDEIRVVEMFRSRQVDGMLIYPTSPRQIDHISSLRRAGFPVVLLIADPAGAVDSVSMNDRLGAERATRHLIEQGHTRIAILQGATQLRIPDKLEGYLKALSDAGITPEPDYCVAPEGPAALDGFDAMQRLLALAVPPTAVFAVTDTLAFGALKAVRDSGRRVPDDVAIIGFDNIPYAEYSAVPLSSVHYAAEEVARGAVERLFDLIGAGDTLPPPRQTLLEPRLVMRESSMKPA